MATTAAIYARISQDREGAGLGVAAQEQDCRDLASKLGIDSVVVYADNDASAHNGRQRPGYLRMLGDIDAGRIDVVLAWHTDRLHRSPVELERYAEVCRPRSVPTHTVKAGLIDLSTASGLMVARILGSVARHEVDHMIERQKRAKLRSAEAGTFKGGRRPFGYEPDGVTIREAEATALRSATVMVLSGGSLSAVARLWNEQRMTTSTGKRWSQTEARRVLLRPRNAGLMEHHGEVVGQAQWPAAVDEAHWSALVSVLSDPSRRTTPGPTRRWLGSGIYRCAQCDETVICTVTHGRRVYRCRPGCVSKSQIEVDAMVEGRLAALMPGLQITVEEPDLTEDRAKSVAIRQRLNALSSLFAQGIIDAQQLTEGSKTLRGELERITQRTAMVMSGLPELVLSPDMYLSWRDSDLYRRRRVLEMLFTVVLRRGKRGRPAGWKTGQSYFRQELVEITPKGVARVADSLRSPWLMVSV